MDQEVYFECKDPFSYQQKWTSRLELYNKWITEGEQCYDRKNLKEGIKSIIDEFDKINMMIDFYVRNGENKGETIV